MLRQDPVVEITSVKTSIGGGLTQVELTADEDYYVDTLMGTIFSYNESVPFLSSYATPFKSIEVVYSAGYAEIPADVELVTVDLVDYYRNNEHKPAQIMGGSSIDNPLPYIGNRFPPHIQRVLDIYRYAP